jgi:hypothetical protein
MMLSLAEQVDLAGGPLLWLALAGIALYIAGAFLIKGPKARRQFDDRPPTLVSQGDQLNYVIGRRMVSYQPTAIYGRYSREESVGGGGKKGASTTPQAKQTVYYESGMVCVCLGPATTLFRIFEGDEVVFEGPVTPDDTPSGTMLQDQNGNSFYIYWGEKNQPVNTLLALGIGLDEDGENGIQSRWPFVCYLHYINRRLGGSATWPQIDFDIEVSCTAVSPLPDSECHIGEGDDKGMNGAHIAYQLISGNYPHGAGLATNYAWTDLKELGELLETEGLPQNVAILDNTLVSTVLADLFADAGVFMPEDQGSIRFIALRSTDVPLDLTENMVKGVLPEFKINHGGFENDRILFQYPDIALNFREGDVYTDDDATARAFRNKKTETVPLNTITGLPAATVVADRRKQLLLADANQVELEVTRTMRRVYPGMTATLAGIGTLRISAVERQTDGGSAKLTASVDNFALAPSEWDPSTPPPTSSGGERTPDTLVRVWEAPRRYSGDRIAIWAIRGREDGGSTEAAVYTSTDGTSYTLAGYQNSVAAYGLLSEDLVRAPSGYTQPRLIERVGPTVTFNAANAARLLDLSGLDNDWRTDRQVMLVDQEIMAVRSFTSEGGGEYRADDVVRRQLYTQPGQHFADEDLEVMVFEPENLVNISRTDWVPGQTIYVKVVPTGISIADIEAVEVTLRGVAFGALPVDNIRPKVWVYPIGGLEDIEFSWTNRINKGTGTGSGELPAGVAVPAYPGPEGDHIVRIYNPSGGLIRTELADTPTTWTYTAAMQTADYLDFLFDEFYIEVTNRLNGVEAYPVRQKINYLEVTNTP